MRELSDNCLPLTNKLEAYIISFKSNFKYISRLNINTKLRKHSEKT